MAAYVLIPGAGGSASYWSRVVVVIEQDDARPEGDAVFGTPCSFTPWPARVRVLAGADDRFFPVDFQRRIASERLGVTADVRPGGHLIALAQPQAVASYLLGA